MEKSQRTSTHPLAVQCAESNRFQPMTPYHPSINNSGIIKTFTAPPNAKHKSNKKHEYYFYRYRRHKNHFLAFKMREHLATQTTNISTSCNYIRAYVQISGSLRISTLGAPVGRSVDPNKLLNTRCGLRSFRRVTNLKKVASVFPSRYGTKRGES